MRLVAASDSEKNGKLSGGTYRDKNDNWQNNTQILAEVVAPVVFEPSARVQDKPSKPALAKATSSEREQLEEIRF
jgi:hypothetical protein